MNLKFFQVYKITFQKDEGGMITKKYEGIIKPENFGDIEAGIAIVVNHIYLQKKDPECMFGACCDDDNLLEIIFEKNATGDFRVNSFAGTITTDDCENVLTGLGELLMRLHLERMVTDDIKITLKQDERTSSVDYSTAESLV